MNAIMSPQMNGVISIEPVANGWIVTIPCMEELKPIPDMGKMIMENAKLFRNEMEKDPLLAELQGKNLSQVEKGEEKLPVFSDLKNKHVHIFTTFDEVLEFLKEKVK